MKLKTMKSVPVRLIMFCLCFACTVKVKSQPKTLTEGAPASGGFSAERLARLDSGMNDWVKKKWVNGSVALIARKGKIVFYKAYGYNDPDTRTPLDKTGIFRV